MLRRPQLMVVALMSLVFGTGCYSPGAVPNIESRGGPDSLVFRSGADDGDII